MVVFFEGDPSIPGNATLTSDEVAAFLSGNMDVVRDAGYEYGAKVADYGLVHLGETAAEASDVREGVRAITKPAIQNLTALQSRVTFTEAVIEGLHNRVQTTVRTAQLADALDTLHTFGQRPEVQTALRNYERETFAKIYEAVGGTA